MNLAGALAALGAAQELYRLVDGELARCVERPALTRKLQRSQADITDAVAFNASACAALCDELLALRPRLNAEWECLYGGLRELPQPRVEPVAAAVALMWQADATVMRERFHLSEEHAAKVARAPQAIAGRLNEAPVLPAVLLDDEWVASTQQMGNHHRGLAVAFGGLKDQLQMLVSGGRRGKSQ
jgi:hypothetical protein